MTHMLCTSKYLKCKIYTLLSHTYLTLLEQGKRKWTPTLRHDYLNEIGK